MYPVETKYFIHLNQCYLGSGKFSVVPITSLSSIYISVFQKIFYHNVGYFYFREKRTRYHEISATACFQAGQLWN